MNGQPENNNEENRTDIKGEAEEFASEFNRYATKKSAVQGLLDFALLAANAAKLRKVLERHEKDSIYYVLLVTLILSLCVQCVAGILIVILAKSTLKTEKERKKADKMNNIISVMLGVVTVLEVAISIVDFTDNEMT